MVSFEAGLGFLGSMEASAGSEAVAGLDSSDLVVAGSDFLGSEVAPAGSGRL